MNKMDVLKNFKNTIDTPNSLDIVILKDFVGDEKNLPIALYILKGKQTESLGSIVLDKKQIEIVNDSVCTLDVKIVRAVILIQVYMEGKANLKLDVNFEIFLKNYSELGNDKRIMLVAVEKNGLLLGFASKELKNDKEVVMKSLRQNAAAIVYVSEELKNDYETISIAVKNQGNNIINEDIIKLKTLFEKLSCTENILKKTVNFDMRFQIKKSEEWPYCLFGFIDSERGEGSGTLVGSNIVLTAAHVIYDKKSNQEEPLDSIYFSPGRNGDTHPYGKIGVKGIVYSTKYQTQMDIPHDDDWALLILETNIGDEIAKKKNKAGWFQLKALDDNELKVYPICITGYPGEKNRTLYEIKGKVHEIQKGIIGYKLDTTSGQSGGGVWTEIEGEKYLIATHQSWTGIENMNWATRWTVEKQQIYQKITEIGITALVDLKLDPNLKITISPKLFLNTKIISTIDKYREAADQGDASAQYNLGFCYATGNGVDKD